MELSLFMSRLKIKNRNQIIDLIAVAFCVALFLLYSYRIRFGIGHMDESFYLSIAQRFAKGDRPLVDEWHVTQLSDLFLVLPYMLFTKVTGGTEGIMLFMRQLFVTVNALFFFVLYGKLRPYRWYGLIAAAVFSSFVPHAMFVLNYYSMTNFALMLISVVLFIDKKSAPDSPISTTKLLFAGTLLSAAVLIQPPLAFLYFLYSITVLIYTIVRKRSPEFGKRFAFFFNTRCWLLMTAAVVVCAGIFLVFLNFKSGLKNVIQNIPNLLSDSYYNASIFESTLWISLLKRILVPFQMFGTVNCILLFLLCIAVFVNKKFNHGSKNQVLYKYILFLLTNVFLLLCFVYPIVSKVFFKATSWNDWNYFTVTPLPFFAFGLINYLLCEKPDPRFILIWFLSLFSSFFTDVVSTATLGTYGIIAVIPGILCFKQIYQEYASDQQGTLSTVHRGKKQKAAAQHHIRALKTGGVFLRISRISFVLFLILICFNIYLQSARLLFEPLFNETQIPLNAIFSSYNFKKIETGPYKGIETTDIIRSNVYDYQADLDIVKNECNHFVYLDNSNPLSFLYLDLPTSNCFTWPSVSFLSRHLVFFEKNPDKRPDTIYFCYDFYLKENPDQSSAQLTNRFARLLCENVCDGSIISGKKGLIVKVNSWKDCSYAPLYEWISETERQYVNDNNVNR